MTPAESSGAARPLVSIIVPVYNGARHLGESLDSLLQQSYGNVEILVMDDASTDETPQVIASYGDAIRSVRQPANRGIYGNANDGIRMARGSLIAIYHADDVYEPEIVEREVALFDRQPGLGAVFCLDVFIDAEGREYGRLHLPADVRGREVLDYPTVLNAVLRYKNQFLVCPTAMVRADVYREVGGYRPERFGIGSDLDMWLRIAQRYPLGMVGAYLLRYRHFHGNASQLHHHVRITPEEHFEIVDAHLADGGRAVATPGALAAHEGHRAEDRLRIAVAYYIRGNLASARAQLGAVSARAILGGANLQKVRLLVLLVGFRVLSRLPRIAVVADVLYRRWYDRRPRGAPSHRRR